MAINDLVKSGSKASPVHWTVLTEKFVGVKGGYTNDELVEAVNSLLLPLGNMRGANHNFWFEN